MKFLFYNFVTYDLDVFIKLKNKIDEIDELKGEFDLLLYISKLSYQLTLSRSTRRHVDEIKSYFSERGIFKPNNTHYSTYALWNGWIRNRTENFIEENYKVYTSNITKTVRDIHSLLNFIEELAKITHTPISNEYDTFFKFDSNIYN